METSQQSLSSPAPEATPETGDGAIPIQPKDLEEHASDGTTTSHSNLPGRTPSTNSDLEMACESFDDMDLREELLRGVYAYGFEKPFEIQQRAIVPCVKGRDAIVQARAGTGKTAMYAISILQQISTSLHQCQALVLAPNRELAKSIRSMVAALGNYMGVRCHACVGGTLVREDMRQMEAGQHIIVGTPGRVSDMIQRRRLRTNDIKMLVLDEADETLQRGFKDQIDNIFSCLSQPIQVVVLSCTVPPEVMEMARRFMPDPICIKDSFYMSL